MRLGCHLISKGKYYQAGEDVPDDEVPLFALKKYAVAEETFVPPPHLRESESKGTQIPRHRYSGKFKKKQ
jgi:hypothetical protein